ncbi:DUF5677 domain-containing protein [Nonomuraea sp. NPDC048916]|uniref:DUF5677 domain-containing protein n=1 Tax=Nonomuraea sp. NPDC048916 TaxID=3154232 RepID=UPI0033ECC75D
MTFSFGDTPSTAKRARKLGELLANEAEQIGRSGGIDVLTDHAAVFYVLFGWWRYISQSARAFWMLSDAKLAAEGAPLVRNIFDHSFSVQWLYDTGGDGLIAIGGAELEKRKKLLEDLQKNGWQAFSQMTLASLPPITVPQAGDPEYARYVKLLGEFRNYADLVIAYGKADVYPVYRTLSSYAHATPQTAQLYVEELPDGSHGVRDTARSSGSYASIIHTTICLVQAADVISVCIKGDPLRKVLEKATKDLGLTAPEYLRVTRKKPLPAVT